jgi:hypothetical protein
LDKTVLTQKIRELSSDKEVSIYLLIDSMKLYSAKVFSYDGIIKKTMDRQLFFKSFYFLNEKSLEMKRAGL